MSGGLTMIGVARRGSGALVGFAVAAAAQPVSQPCAPARAATGSVAPSSRSYIKGMGPMKTADDVDHQRALAIIFADDPLPSRSVMEARLSAKLEHRRTFEDYEILGLDAVGTFAFAFDLTVKGASTSGLRIDLHGSAWRDAACITPSDLRTRLGLSGWEDPAVTTQLIQQLEFRRAGLTLRAEHNGLCMLRLDIVQL